MKEGPIVVLGGSSGTGRRIVELLQQQGRPVRVLSRRPAAAAGRLPSCVEAIYGDLTKPDTIVAGLRGAAHLVLTAGVYSGWPATAAYVRAVEYVGVSNALRAAIETGLPGRFLYMTASGLRGRSPLNLWKGNTLKWRLRVETQIRRSGLDYAIIRVGVLLDRPRGWRAIEITQAEQPLSLGTRISRADVAAVFVASIDHPAVSRATFEVVGRRAAPARDLKALLSTLRPDTVNS